MHWQKVTLVGVGLLGGSLGLALRQRGLARTVAGYVRRAAAVADCRRLGVTDEAGLDLRAAVTGADLVVLCTPVAQMAGLMESMLPALEKSAMVTDVGSVKSSVIAAIEVPVANAGAHFIGSHPMAGAEQTGVGAARSDLFEGAVCVLTPTARSDPEGLARVRGLWESVGAVPVVMGPERHDELVARSSHLPHFVAATLAAHVLDPARSAEQALLCATGFGDTTRIACGSPEMWRDIAQANPGNLSRALGDFIEDLEDVRRLLEVGDGAAIEAFLATAKERRDAWRAGA